MACQVIGAFGLLPLHLRPPIAANRRSARLGAGFFCADTAMKDPLEEILKRKKELLLKSADYDHAGLIEIADKRCESPIENLFFVAYFSLSFVRSHFVDEFGLAAFSIVGKSSRKTLPSKTPGWPDRNHVAGHINIVTPQFDTGIARVDFAIEQFIRIPGEDPFFLPTMIVECDGHDFHERTKDQAAKDRGRDRELQEMGYIVYRFTGSELWANAMGCARQVEDFFSKKSKEIAAIRAAAKAPPGNP